MNIPTKEFSWLVQHPEIEEQFVGEWIAVQDGKVIAHGPDLERVIKQTADLESPPHLTYVEEVGLAAYALHFFL